MNAATALENQCAVQFGRKFAIALGRGTWALALLLKAIEPGVPRRILALPSFLCHTPLAAIHYAGWTPLFCDVDPATGLVPNEEWAAAIAMGAEAVLLVHLFGNPARIDATAALCRKMKVFLIEDACQSLGATCDGRPCGAFGDASILSFGHTKTIDVGSGGLLLTDDAALAATVADLASRQNYLPAQRYDSLSKEASRLFYARKDQMLHAQDHPAELLRGLTDPWRELVPAPWTADAGEISRQLDRLPALAAARRRKAALYTDLLAGTAVEPIRMAPDAAPWRFCFRIPGIERKQQEALSSALRSMGVHVSNWYLPTHWMAQLPLLATGGLAKTLRLSAEIFQFWLDDRTEERHIRDNAKALKLVLAA